MEGENKPVKAKKRGRIENLVDMKSRTPEERSAIGRKGALASVEARRKRKSLKEDLIAILSDKKTQENINMALIRQALDGNVKAFEVIRDTIGEKHVEKLEVVTIDATILDEVENLVKEK